MDFGWCKMLNHVFKLHGLLILLLWFGDRSRYNLDLIENSGLKFRMLYCLRFQVSLSNFHMGLWKKNVVCRWKVVLFLDWTCFPFSKQCIRFIIQKYQTCLPAMDIMQCRSLGMYNKMCILPTFFMKWKSFFRGRTKV